MGKKWKGLKSRLPETQIPVPKTQARAPLRLMISAPYYAGADIRLLDQPLLPPKPGAESAIVRFDHLDDLDALPQSLFQQWEKP